VSEADSQEIMDCKNDKWVDVEDCWGRNESTRITVRQRKPL